MCNLQTFTQQGVFKITTKELFDTPISSLLYGNFIELGYGLQVEAMWGEMLFNRSFEPFKAYTGINKAWYDLYYDERHPQKGYEKDWSEFDWYHSGYEHNAWYAAPGIPDSPSYISDESTFFKNKADLLDVKIEPMKGGSGHGKQCLKLLNNEFDEWGAVAQDGKLFKKGETYIFRGKIKSVKDAQGAEIRFYKQGDWNKPIGAFPIKDITTDYSEKTIVFENKDYDGYVTFSLWIPPKSEVLLDDFSLMPKDTYYGWCNEVVEVFK